MSMPISGTQSTVGARPSLAPAQPETHGIPKDIFEHYYEQCQKVGHSKAVGSAGELFRRIYGPDAWGGKTWGAVAGSLSDCLFDIFKPVVIHEYKQIISPREIVQNLKKDFSFPFAASATADKICEWAKDPVNDFEYRSQKNRGKTKRTKPTSTLPVPQTPNTDHERNPQDAWSYQAGPSELSLPTSSRLNTQESGVTADPSDLLAISPDPWLNYNNSPFAMDGFMAGNEPAMVPFNGQPFQMLAPAPNTGAMGPFNGMFHPQPAANLGVGEFPLADHSDDRAVPPQATQFSSQRQQTTTASPAMQQDEGLVQSLRRELARLEAEVENKKRKIQAFEAEVEDKTRKIQALEFRNDQLGRQNESLKIERLMATAGSSQSRQDQLKQQNESPKVTHFMSADECAEVQNNAAPTTPTPKYPRNNKRTAPGMPRRNTTHSHPGSLTTRQSSYRGHSSSQATFASRQNLSSPTQYTSSVVGDQSSMATSPYNNQAMSSQADIPFSQFSDIARPRRGSASSTASNSDGEVAQALRRRQANVGTMLDVRAWRDESLPRQLIRRSSADHERDLAKSLGQLTF
ncbi:hypothetical protein A1O7_02201 [Cladophialophora yegresii CBS 114405]|uniref:Uncharacterized protein n=1 Tax=Cladophialophora yegresii CBS 114405 TaxID=1182544 RepID=W9WB50_9EURO|nr:uncharacterized protein A1O7_02201 [Cladophialophora yegresii CBS 114405]EXJ61771.1 hypothetical protein A1O7_02201 [Cladophialophora yegresii CBS 114405]